MNLRPVGYSLFLGSVLLLAKAAFGDPSADFSQAVSLFNAKDYLSAMPLFQQIVQGDPGNAKAYYYLGSCQETAGDLRGEVLNYDISNKLSPDADMKAYADKMMEKLSPEDQDWVEKNLDAFSRPAAQPATQSSPPAPNNDYSQAVSLYDTKQYAAALPLFQQVVQDQPDNAKAYYYLGRCQDKAGYLRGAALSFYISNRIQPYPALKVYADKVMAKLPPGDQDWVEKHLEYPSQPAAAAQTLSPVPAPAAPTRFGVRFSTSLALFSLSDFQKDIAYRQGEVAAFEGADPGGGYALQTKVADLVSIFEVNPYLTLDTNGELGIALRYWPSVAVSYNITASAFPGYFVNSEFDLSSFELLLKGRVYFPKSDKAKTRFFIEPGAGIQPISLNRTYTYADTAGSPASDQTGENLGGLAFDALFNMGAAFTLSPSALFSLSAGYQVSVASGFSGTWSDSAVPAKNGAKGSERLYTNPTTGQSDLIFVPDDPNLLSAFGENQGAITYSRPLSVDQSGFLFSADFSVIF